MADFLKGTDGRNKEHPFRGCVPFCSAPRHPEHKGTLFPLFPFVPLNLDRRGSSKRSCSVGKPFENLRTAKGLVV